MSTTPDDIDFLTCLLDLQLSLEYHEYDAIAAALRSLSYQVAELTRERDALRKDAERLDYLEAQSYAYGCHIYEGNRWIFEGPFANLRSLADFALAAQKDDE